MSGGRVGIEIEWKQKEVGEWVGRDIWEFERFGEMAVVLQWKFARLR